MKKEEVFYYQAVSQSEEQDNRRRHFDTLAVGVLGFSAALVGLASFTVGRWSWWSVLPFVGMVAAFLFTAYYCWNELRLRAWLKQPKLEDLQAHVGSGEHSDVEIVGWAARQITLAVLANEDNLSAKAAALQAAYVSTAIEGLAAAIFIAVVATNTLIS